MPGPGCSGSKITAEPTLCSLRKRAASRRLRPGVIVSTSWVIASRTFTPAPLRRQVGIGGAKIPPLMELRRPTTTRRGSRSASSPPGRRRSRARRCRERRELARGSDEVDAVRRLLCHEPRGHADMYGCFPVPPDDDGADLGVLFWHKDGYSTACGHGTIALGAWAVESGRVACEPDGEVDVTIDVPSGRVVARVRCAGGAVGAVTFRNVPAYVIARGVEAAGVRVDVAYGGAIYASVAAADLGLEVVPERLGELIAAGREIKRCARGHRRGAPSERRPALGHLRHDPL